MNTFRSALFLTVGTALFAFSGCANLNDPYYQPSGSPYYGNSYDSGYYDNNNRDRWENERERRRLEEERRRLERERERDRDRWNNHNHDHDNYDHRPNRPPPPPPPAQDRCPSGFSPSENKCSPEERKRGCKDIRLPSGLGCVRR